MMGHPPHRIDIVTKIDGIDFAEAWPGRVEKPVAPLICPVINIKDLITNKRASARPQDLADVQILEDIVQRQS